MLSTKTNKEATLLDTGIFATFGGVAVAAQYYFVQLDIIYSMV